MPSYSMLFRILLIFLFINVILFSKEHEIRAEYVNITELKSNWTLINRNQSVVVNDLSLPSGVYSALYGDEVLHSFNDVRLRWVAHDNWTYTTKFAVDLKQIKTIGNVNLTFNGIDTISEIRLNHNLLGRTDNMFVRYTYDVKKWLQAENVLEVELTSPIHAALAKARLLESKNKTVPPECPPKRYNGECHMNMLRKMQASFAWDWGLAAPSMGIWKSVTLDYYDIALLRDVDVIIDRNATHWKMLARVFIDAIGTKDFYAKLTFYAFDLLDNAVIVYDYSRKPISYKAPVIEFEQAIPIDKVTAWWPNGSGEQKLYPLQFTLNAWSSGESPDARAKSISHRFIQIGFRTIELVEKPTINGNTFLFKVNGEEIFMKGSNYIPSHILPEMMTEDRIKHILESAKEANMNMIRVWGGGIYESNYFYSLADRLGILIWQDMMFACAMYPVEADFLASVRKEVQQNAKRLSHHPSIAIFAGNNENEVALAQNWYQTFYENKRFKAEYRQLYLGTVLHELKVVEHSARPHALVSSPSNGKESAKDQYLSPDPQNNNYGDVHFYEYFKDGWNPNIFPRPRFSSEYGFQSLPSMEAWKRVASAKDDLIDLVNHRQHLILGMEPILNLIRKHLPLPLPEDDNYLEALIYFSQIVQAMATKIETELYRSLRDTEHHTMGALYWQLNDIWVAPSWSSIDFHGNYKLLHYWAKDFLAPITITALYDMPSKSINVSLICDRLRVNTADLKVTQNVYLWSQLYAKESVSWPVTLKANGVQYDKVIPISQIFQKDLTSSNSFVEFVLQRGDRVVSRTYYFPTIISAAKGIQDPEIKCSISSHYCNSRNEVNSYSLALTAKYPAVFVYLELTHPEIPNYKLSKNGFMQVTPIEIVHLEYHSKNCLNITSRDIKILTVNQFMYKSPFDITAH